MFQFTTIAMSTERHPTLQQVLPFFNILMNRMNHFLNCGENESPNMLELHRQGKTEGVINGIVACRAKIMKYYNRSELPVIHVSCTGTMF
jgi:hypothetical protein